MEIANTPPPPYYAVIFTSIRTEIDEGYQRVAAQLVALAQQQRGYLGMESARDTGVGITVSYWQSLEDIRRWKEVSDHQLAQQYGREKWYAAYHTRICRVERAYCFDYLSHKS